jgi:molybdenum cofactor synthesis domain-containing protein
VITLEEARRYVLSLGAPLGPVSLPLGEVRGLVLAEAVIATELVPPFANTAMDGFAVRAADTGPDARLTVIGTVAAGAVFPGMLGAGQAVRIMTGAPMPAGADAVVMVELTTVEGDEVVVAERVEAGLHVRPAGDDIVPGDEVLPVGTVISPTVMSVLATLGRTAVTVIRRPRVGVLSTGDELVGGGGPLGPGQIRDSNRGALIALADEAGWEAVDLGLIPDDETAIEAALRSGAADCDVVLTSGGVSMGDFDFVKVVLDRIGDMRWMQVDIRPAKPLAAGTVGGTPIIGLPGNPVSSVVSFEMFARPAIARLAGRTQLDRPRIGAVASDGLPRRPDGRTHFVRVRLAQRDDLSWEARTSGGQGSHHTAALAAADGLAVVADGTGIEPGGSVEVIPL